MPAEFCRANCPQSPFQPDDALQTNRLIKGPDLAEIVHFAMRRRADCKDFSSSANCRNGSNPACGDHFSRDNGRHTPCMAIATTRRRECHRMDNTQTAAKKVAFRMTGTPKSFLLGVGRVLRGAILASSIGAFAAFQFGFVFACLIALLREDSVHYLSVASYCAWCGALAGALVGLGGTWMEDDDFLPEAIPVPPTPAQRYCSTVIADRPAVPSMVPSNNRLETATTPVNLLPAALAARKPSRN